MRLLISLFASVLFSGSAAAHDFWLNPADFTMSEPGTNAISIRIGHAEDMSNWPADPDRVISFRKIGSDGISDLQNLIRPSQNAFDVDFDTKGFHLVAIETTHAASELEADFFNNYVEEEGLTPIRKARKVAATMDEPGREIYSRRGKALVLTGDLPEEDPDFILKPLGMTLEVTPINNPYRAESGDAMAFQITFRGRPLKGAQVMLVSLDTIAGDVASEISDSNGHVTFKRPSAGEWMVHTVWSDPIADHPLGDFDTTFSSFSFGF